MTSPDVLQMSHSSTCRRRQISRIVAEEEPTVNAPIAYHICRKDAQDRGGELQPGGRHLFRRDI